MEVLRLMEPSLCCQNGDKKFRFWQLAGQSPKQVKTFQATLPVRNGLTISNDGNFVAVALGTYRDGEGHRTIIEIWETNNEENPYRIFNTGDILGVWEPDIFTSRKYARC